MVYDEYKVVNIIKANSMKLVIIFCKGIGCLLIGLILLSCKKTTTSANAAVSSDTIRTYQSIDTLLMNPGMGFYKWNYQEQAPVKSLDSYARFNWSDLEKSKGKYDFSVLSTAAASAYSNANGRGRFAFAIRCCVEGINKAYPAYVDSSMKGWYSTAKSCWVPDWNNAYFLERLDSLVSALGRTFNNDARIGFVEIRSYGNWGEWHLAGFESPVSPAVPITNTTIERMINAYTNAFPNKQLVMMSDNPYGLQYAMTRNNPNYPIGWRRDSWGNKQMESLVNSTAWSFAKDRWKTAPVIVEGYGTGTSGMNYSLCVPQTAKYHISAIGNANYGVWSSMTKRQQDSILMSVKQSGYKYSLQTLTISDSVITGKDFNMKTKWSNIGNAPTYLNWTVTYLLLDAKSLVVKWQATSSLNLKSVLPTIDSISKKDFPITVYDNYTLPVNLPAGDYQLELMIKDASNYYAPLQLLNKDRRTDGGYLLGTVRVMTR